MWHRGERQWMQEQCCVAGRQDRKTRKMRTRVRRQKNHVDSYGSERGEGGGGGVVLVIAGF